MRDVITVDAQEYGAHVRSGGWRLGMLVARSVETGTGQGARTDVQPRNDRYEVDKVSAQEFARRAGTSAPRVLRHLTAWEKAAHSGVVPSAATVAPGEDVILPEDPELWSRYYSAAAAADPGQRLDEPRRERLTEHAREAGVRPSIVHRVAANPEAMEAAISADPQVAEVARKALAEHQQARAQREDSEPRSWWDVMDLLDDASTAVQSAVRAASRQRSQPIEDATRIITSHLQEIRAACDMVDAALGSGGITDENLERFLAGGQ